MKAVDLACRFAIQAGAYIDRIHMLGYYTKDTQEKIGYYGSCAHDASQCLTWVTQILSGKEVRAWGEKDTEGVLRQMKACTRKMASKIERLKEAKENAK